MMNRASVDSPFAVTSLKQRATIERRLSSSALADGCWVTLLLASSEQAAQIGIQGRVLVRLVVNHAALPVALENASVGKILKLTLEAGRRHFHAAGQLRDIPGFFGLHERRRQNSLAGLGEQGIEGTCITHVA